ncbi:hypothetical protein HK098_003841 [Nowakowskiella sp. JEL0407]|nr:hypothetical protein HK098_003841 [Nowakowskiella sp. JEL0407]
MPVHDHNDNGFLTPEQAAAQAHSGYTVVPQHPHSEVPPYSDNSNSAPSSSTFTYPPPNVSANTREYVLPNSDPNPSATTPLTSPPPAKKKKSFIEKFKDLSKRTKILIITGVVVVLVAITVVSALAATGVFAVKPLVAIILSSNTKQQWMNVVQADFNAKGFPIENSKQPAAVNITHGTSNVSTVAPLPDGWSPQHDIWIQQMVAEYKANNTPLFPNGNQDCKAIAVSPFGIAMWKPMAEALGWPKANIGWKNIIELAGNSTGWRAYGKPWGTLRFGHAQPEVTNSGRLTLVAALFALTNATTTLQLENVNSATASTALAKLSASVQHMGADDLDLLDLMGRRGLTYLHAVATYEVSVIQWNIKFPSQERLVFIYPSDGTFWPDHPLCILSSDPQKASIVKKFRDFALNRESQVKLVQNGMRPVPAFSDISLTNTPGSTFSQANGALAEKNNENVRTIPYPNGDTMGAVINLWRTVKKSSVTLLVIDTSGSMSARSNGVSSLDAVKAAASSFISGMLPQDYLVILQFSTASKVLIPSGSTGSATNLSTFALTANWRSNAISQINDLLPEGNTLLYDSIGQANDLMNGFRNADIAANLNRNYGIIVMTDGKDEKSNRLTTVDALISTLPTGAESDQVHIYTIGFGDDVNADELTKIANRTNGKYYHGNAIIVFLAIFVDILCYSIIIPFIPFIVKNFGGEDKDTGFLLAIYAVGSLLPSPFIGLWSDKMKNRKIPMLVGLFALLVSTILFAVAKSYWVLGIARFFQGASSAFTWTLGLSLLADTFPHSEMGKASSIALSAYTVAQTAGPPIGGALYLKFGYYPPFYLCIAIIVVDFIGRWLIIEVPKDGVQYEATQPTIAAADSVTPPLQKADGTTAETLIDQNSDVTVEQQTAKTEPTMKSIFLSRPIAIISIITIVSGSALTALEPTLPLLLATNYGMNTQDIGLTFLALVVPSIVIGPIVGHIYDKIGFFRVILPGLILSLVATPLLILFETAKPALVVLLFLLFLFALSVTVIIAPMTPEISACVPNTSYGLVYGIYSMCFSAGMIIGPSVLGGVPYQYLGWKWQMVILTGAFLICLPLVFFYKRPVV